MVSNTDLNSNFVAIMQLPIVKRTLKCVNRLTRENKELKKENEMLKKMIDILFDKPLTGNTNCCGGCHNSTQSPISEVHIKKEKNIIDMSTEPENITYELQDTCNTADKPFTYGDDGETIWNDNVGDNTKRNDMANDITKMDIKELEVEEESEVEEVEVEVEVEESEEEVEVEVEVEESEEEVKVEESEEEVEAEESEEEVYEVTIKNKSYYTTNETDGPIYAIIEDEDIGDQIGEFKEGKPTFYRKTKK